MDATTTFRVCWDHSRHTCIVVGQKGNYVHYIPMEALETRVVRMSEREFTSVYTPVPDYPVKRAAEIYLGAPGKTVSPQARDLLKRIMADPALEYDRSKFSTLPIHQPHKESAIMATKKTAAPAAEDTKPVKKTAAATKATKAAAAEPAKKTRTPKEDNGSYTVADDSSVKRGFIADYVAAAKKLGTFTKDKLNSKFADVDEAKLGRYFYYCTGHGIFAAAA